MELRKMDMRGRIFRVLRRALIGPFKDAPANRRPLGIITVTKGIELCGKYGVTIYGYYDASHNAYFLTDTAKGVFEGIEQIGFKKYVFTPEIYCRYGERSFHAFLGRLRPNALQIHDLDGLKLLIEHAFDTDETWNPKDYRLPSQY